MITNRSQIKVLIVDDHPITRIGLSLFLASYPDLVPAGEAASSDEALSFCERELPDVVLLDLRLPELDGFNTLLKLRDSFPEVKVLILTSYHDPSLVERALRGGANGYLLKEISAFDLAGAIRAAHQGRAVLTARTTESLVEIVRQHKDSVLDLTEREHDVLDLIVQGLSNADIADRLGVSYSTVKFHVGRILSKLGAPSRAMAVTLAWQRNLVSQHDHQVI